MYRKSAKSGRTVRRFAVASVLACVPPQAAQASDRWTHAASGAVFPERFEAQRIKERRDLGTPNDSVIDYEGDGIESTTIYIFRATVPHARLWFDRAVPIVGNQIPLDKFTPGPVEKTAVFGSTAPNALRQLFTTSVAGPFKATTLLVAQAGPWIVKVRATSASLDGPALAERTRRHLNAITFASVQPAALDPLPACPAAPTSGAGKTVSESAALAAGDAGKAVASRPVDGGKPDGPAVVLVSTPADVRGAALFDAPAAVQAAVPVLTGRGAPLFTVGSSRDPAAR